MTDSSSWINQAWPYIPQDRRLALAYGTTLPEHVEGAALFADISGSTSLTEALAATLGLRRGAEQLSFYLNAIYDALIGEVERYRGSVINFAGDSITCWFDETGAPTGELFATAAAGAIPPAALRAITCGVAMQAAMQNFAAVSIPGREPVTLAVKVAVACGPALRYLTGNPAHMHYDVLAGETIYRMAEAEHYTGRGEVVLDQPTVEQLGERIEITEWRHEEGGKARDFAVLASLKTPAEPTPWPALPVERLNAEIVRPRLHAAVYERMQAGLGEFLTELRPTIALFVRFGDVGFGIDPQAGERLNEYIRAVQELVTRSDGSLMEISIGDKGNYLYINYGACISHEDDAQRAVRTALELRDLKAGLGEGAQPAQIGVTRGVMRVGGYGGTTRRSFGALGDEVNVAARLMQRAAPGEVLISRRVNKELTAGAAGSDFRTDGLTFDPRPPVHLKGKAEPVPIFAVTGLRQHRAMRLQEPGYGLPMVGREAELAVIAARIEQALRGQGQVVGVTAEPGMGKSRLAAEAIRMARARGLEGYGGACQSDGVQMPYLVWKPIWAAFFNLDTEAPLDHQAQTLQDEVQDLVPERLEALPLLGELLGLPLPENDFTLALEPRHRRTALEALLLDCLRAATRQVAAIGVSGEGGLLFVLEDVHWIDAASRDLLERIARAIPELPVLIVLAFRPPEFAHVHGPGAETARLELDVSALYALPNFTLLRLSELAPAQIEQALLAKLAQFYPDWTGEAPQALIERITAQAQGNPFYAEELLNYLHDRDLDLCDPAVISQVELPASLNSLVISRIDQLATGQQLTIKVASVLGRVFTFEHLLGVYPDLGDAARVKADLDQLSGLELTPLENPEPELAYLFKHLITHAAAYEMLAETTRTRLHEQYAAFLEARAGANVEAILDQLAYHYERSNNSDKRREYLFKAGVAAQRRYANDAAVDYYQRVLPLLPPEQQPGALLRQGQVLELLGRWEAAEAVYLQALELAQHSGDQQGQAQALSTLAELDRKRGRYSAAAGRLQQAGEIFAALGDRDGQAQVLHFQGTLATHQGDFTAAQQLYEASLKIRRAQGDNARAAALLSNLGIIARINSRLDEARRLNEEALALRRSLGDKWAIAVSLNNLGNVATDQGRYDEARRLHEEGLALRREVGDMWVVANSLNNLGNLARDQGDYAAAEARYRESLQLVREYNDRWAMAYLFEDMGRLAGLQNRPKHALRLAGAAESLRRAIGAPRSDAEQQKLDESLAVPRQSLGELAAAVYSEGGQMSIEQAAAYAAGTE